MIDEGSKGQGVGEGETGKGGEGKAGREGEAPQLRGETREPFVEVDRGR